MMDSLIVSHRQLALQMTKIRRTMTRGGDGVVLSVRTREKFNSISKRRGSTTGRNACDFRGFTTWQTASKPTSIEDVFLMFAQLGIHLVNYGKRLSNKIGKPLFFEF